MDPIKVALAVQGGLSPICATCNKYWKAREQNVPDGRCLAVDGCGGPLVGDDFHEYEGPMTDFSRWCFVCGEDAHAVVSVNKTPSREVGHWTYFSRRCFVCGEDAHAVVSVKGKYRVKRKI